MQGLGDNIMQRPFVRAAAERESVVYLRTPWPELYCDMPNVRPVRSLTALRTQAKNERASKVAWSTAPAAAQKVVLGYGGRSMAVGSISDAMEAVLPLGSTPYRLDLPDVGRAPRIDTKGKPLAIIRPVTERREWLNASRNPRPEYIAQIAEVLSATHYVVCVADLQADLEWRVGPMPVCDRAFMHGEIPTMDLLALMRSADLVVGGVGFIVPAALALETRCFVVLGGQGGHNHPRKIVDPRADSSRLGWAWPRSYCLCSEKTHLCDKTVDGVLEQFEAWAVSQGVCHAKNSVRLGGRVSAAVA